MANGTRQSSWLRRVGQGAFAVSSLAALGLAATVAVARTGLHDATLVLVRGEGEELLERLRRSVREPPSAALLARLVAEEKDSGLRYLALVDPRNGLWLEAGTEELRDRGMKPGEVRIEGRRVRLVQPLPGRQGGPQAAWVATGQASIAAK